LPLRTEGGNGSYIPYSESRPASPAKPWNPQGKRKDEDQLWHGKELYKQS